MPHSVDKFLGWYELRPGIPTLGWRLELLIQIMCIHKANRYERECDGQEHTGDTEVEDPDRQYVGLRPREMTVLVLYLASQVS